MSEDEAKAWIADRFGAAAVDRLSSFAELLVAANATQNLIAPSTVTTIWNRHLLDSAQLVPLADEGAWLDIGSGGGLPGIVVALLVDTPVILCEPRKLRARFLSDIVGALRLEGRVITHAAKVEAIGTRAAIISARAVASIDAILTAAQNCGARDTIWLLPRGQSWAADVEGSRLLQRGTFHVEHSLTDPHARIVVARGFGTP